MTPTIRVVLADDHLIVRQGLRSLLESSGRFEVVAEADNGFRAIELAEELAPDIVLFDLSMDGPGIVETIKLMRQSAKKKLRIVVLTMHTTAEFVRMALRSGVDGYVVKGASIGDLCEALERVNSGEKFFSPNIEEAVIADLVEGPERTGTSNPLDRLTKREREVLQHIVEGKSTRAIAEVLALSVKTIGWYRTRLMEKLGCHDVTALTRFAIRHRIVEP